METKSFLRGFYKDVETVAEGYLSNHDVGVDEINSILEQEFADISYPVDASESGREHVKTSFGLSSLVAEELSQCTENSYFFKERADDFREFYSDFGLSSQGYGKNELVQFANLYSALAEEESFEVNNYSPETLILQDRESVAEAVSELLGELAEKY